MREIYLASFEGMVKKEKPWTIMNAYNKLNGTYLCEKSIRGREKRGYLQ